MNQLTPDLQQLIVDLLSPAQLIRLRRVAPCSAIQRALSRVSPLEIVAQSRTDCSYYYNWDFDKLSQSAMLTMKLMEQYRRRWGWGSLSSNPWLGHLDGPINFIERFGVGHWNWSRLSSNPALARLTQDGLTLSIINRYFQYWDWGQLSKNPALTETVIEQSWGRWDLNSLSSNPSLTLKLIERHIRDWNWKELSANRCWAVLSEQEMDNCLEKYYRLWDWSSLSGNPALTVRLIELYDWRSSSWDQTDGMRGWDWDQLSANPSLTPEFIQHNSSCICWNWKLLSANPSLTPELIIRFQDKWNWKILSSNLCFASQAFQGKLLSFFNRYYHVLYWDLLCANPFWTSPYHRDIIPELINRFQGLGGSWQGWIALTHTCLNQWEIIIDYPNGQWRV